MKHTGKRILALALSAALCLGLGGCGDKEEETASYQTLAQEIGYGYLAEYSSLDSLGLEYIDSVSSAQGKLYFSGTQYTDEGYSESKLFAYDPAAGTSTEIPMPELENTDDTSEYFQSMTVCPDGSGYWLSVNRYHFVMDEEWDTEVSETDAVEDAAEASGLEDADGLSSTLAASDSDEPEDQYFLRKYDMSGNLLLELDMTPISEETGYFYCDTMAQDTGGSLYASCDGTLYHFGPDGERLSDVDCGDMYIQSMTATDSGLILLSGFSYEDGYNQICRLENGVLTKLDIPELDIYGNCQLYPGTGDTALLGDGTLLHSLDPATGTLTKLLSWLDSDINGNNISGVAASGEDKIMVVTNRYLPGEGRVEFELGTLTKTPADQIPQRTILTLGAVYLDDVVQDAIIDFNRKSTTCRVTLIDYSDYNTEDDYSAGEEQLSRDIIAGSCPDILFLDSSSASVKKFISKGALADLTPLMEEDGDVAMTDLLSGPTQALAGDGKLYGIPYSFSLRTLFASAKLVGDRESWTMADLLEIAQGLDEDVLIQSYSTQQDFLSSMVYWNMDKFVDYSSATCHFDSAEFQDLLALSALLPAEYTYDDDSEEVMAVAAAEGDEYSLLQTGDVLMASSYVYDSWSINQMYNLYTKENGLIRVGYPTSGGSGALLSPGYSLAISSGCKHPAEAWDFVKTMLSDTVQENLWDLPVTVSGMNKVLSDAMEKDYYTDPETNEKVYYDTTGYIGDTEYTIGDLTQAQADDFIDYVNSASFSGSYDEDIMNILNEESAAYFSGDKSASEVAGLIQSRVTIYLGETS